MTPTPQDAEAVARPDLTAETLAWLEYEIADRLRWIEEAKPLVGESVDAWKRQAERLAHAAACVRRVPELEAEVERLRAMAAIVDAIDSGKIAVRRWDRGTIEIAKDVGGGFTYHTGPTILAAYAAATREGT